jgi:hypothetical protein
MTGPVDYPAKLARLVFWGGCTTPKASRRAIGGFLWRQMTSWIRRSPWWPGRRPRSSPPGCASCCAPARCMGPRVSWRSATRHLARYAAPGVESNRWPGAVRTDAVPRQAPHPGVARLARALAAPGGGQGAGVAQVPVAAAVAKRPRAHRERAGPHSIAPPGRTCRRSGGQRGAKRRARGGARRQQGGLT